MGRNDIIVNPQEIDIPFLTTVKDVSLNEIFENIETRGFSFVFSRINWPDQFPLCVPVTVSTLHDGKNIYLRFTTTEPDVAAHVTADQGPVAQDSCVEFFVSPLPSSGRYWNFEFNAIGRKNVSTRIERPNPRRLTATELARILTVPSLGDAPLDSLAGETTWTLDVAIPLDLIGIEYTGQPIEMTGNFYKCASASSSPHYITCAPIDTPRPDFHRPECFLKITLL